MSIYAFLNNCSNQKCSSLFSYNLYQYKFTYCCSVSTKSKQKASFPERKFHEIFQSLFFVNALDLANFAILIFFRKNVLFIFVNVNQLLTTVHQQNIFVNKIKIKNFLRKFLAHT